MSLITFPLVIMSMYLGYIIGIEHERTGAWKKTFKAICKYKAKQ